MSVVKGACPIAIRTHSTRGERASMTLGFEVVENHTRFQLVRCGNELSDKELPSTANVIGGSGVGTYDRFVGRCLILLTSTDN